MVDMRGWSAATAALVVSFGLAAGSARAAETVIDGFTSASALTRYVPNTNVLRNTVGTETRVDPALTEVIGDVRQLDVSATALAIPGLDFVVAGVVAPILSFFEYNSTADADGNVVLTYDRGGLGLFEYLAFAQGIRVTILEADLAAVALPGLDITVTLTDADMNTAQSTQTVTLPVTFMAPLALDFAFADFAGVDIGNLFSIVIAAEPQVAGDLRLDRIETYGTPLEEAICDDGIDNNNNGFTDCRDQNCVASLECRLQAPALSPAAMGSALLLVSLIGLGALRRMRRA